MRLWSLHPRYLDRQGLTACWREALLAQAVLAGTTRGYTRHPQLARFQACAEPLAAVGAYLAHIADEAERREYRFDRSRIAEPRREVPLLRVTEGQLAFEWSHLRAKLAARSPAVATAWSGVIVPDPHPLFVRVPGDIAPWERAG